MTRRVAALLTAAVLAAAPLAAGQLAEPALGARPAAPQAASQAASGSVGSSDDSSSGWRLVGEQDFDSGLGSFTPYGGTPGCCQGTLWDSSQTTVTDGHLQLRTSRDASGTWISGGAGGYNWAAGTREYGKWEARVRFDPGHGVWAALLLWPTSNSWPPEVDFYEIFPSDALRRTLVATSHYGPTNQIVTDKTSGDFTGWHTVAVEWTADRLAYVLDGKVWSVVDDPAAIPHQPMWLGIQTTLGSCPDTCPSSATPGDVDLDVDWVKVYAPARGSSAVTTPSATASATASPSAPAGSGGATGTQPAPSGTRERTRPGAAGAARTSSGSSAGRVAVWVVVAALLGAAAGAAAVVGRRRRQQHRHPH